MLNNLKAPTDPRANDRNFKMSHDPYNVRILAHEIMAAVNWLTDNLPPDVPIIINFGENHGFPSHTMGQLALLQELQQSRHKFAFGNEQPHDQLNDVTNINYYADLLADAHQFSLAVLLKYCIEQNVPVSFNDAARTDDSLGFLNTKDEFTERLIKNHPDTNIDKLIASESDLGLIIRNQAIIQNALTHLEETESKIYVQHCGMGHILGAMSLVPMIYAEYEDGLSFGFNKEGCAVINVLSNPQYLQVIPTKADTDKGVRIMPYGISQDRTTEFAEREILSLLNKHTPNLNIPQWIFT